MIEFSIQLHPWFILLGLIAYISIIFIVDRYRQKRSAARFEKHQRNIRHFNWLSSMGLEETRWHFNTIGQNDLLHPQWNWE